MKIGCHVSISGGLDRAVINAQKIDCTAFQIFTRNPRGWRARPITDEMAASFKENLAASYIDAKATCAHMPYLPNLAGPKPEQYKKSVDTLVDEVKRCGILGIPYLVTHLGSHLGTGEEAGIRRLINAYETAGQVENNVTILLENTAGQKNSVGSDFTQLADILFQLEPQDRFGVCIDTCHAFVAGYDMRNKETATDTLRQIEDIIGYKHLRIIHLNDAQGDLGCNLDRHHHIGLGSIGEEGLGEVVRTAASRDIPVILETPIDSVRTNAENLEKARSLE